MCDFSQVNAKNFLIETGDNEDINAKHFLIETKDNRKLGNDYSNTKEVPTGKGISMQNLDFKIINDKYTFHLETFP